MSHSHEVKRTLHEEVFVPAHPARQETSEYKHAHHQIVVVEDQPCWGCGVRHSTLDDAEQNPHDASAIETHHILEWSLMGCLDAEKVNRLHLPYLRKLGYDGPDLTVETLPDFVDHSRWNLIPLCSSCHRSVHRGIHGITSPIYLALRLARDGYQLVPEDAGSKGSDPAS